MMAMFLMPSLGPSSADGAELGGGAGAEKGRGRKRCVRLSRPQEVLQMKLLPPQHTSPCRAGTTAHMTCCRQASPNAPLGLTFCHAGRSFRNECMACAVFPGAQRPGRGGTCNSGMAGRWRMSLKFTARTSLSKHGTRHTCILTNKRSKSCPCVSQNG